ncbi:MAG TPA: GAF domain-containing protein [Flavobacteriaceae bacterium]|nr:GAF domain-containing protein [Flavobacteriaceae bacterium]
MEKQSKDFPADIKLGFKKVIDAYHSELKSAKNKISQSFLKDTLEYLESFPKLVNGIESEAELEAHSEPINLLMDHLFPHNLTQNEIKAAIVPMQNIVFKKTERLQKIIKNAGADFKWEVKDNDHERHYITAGVHILNHYYNYQIEFSRPLVYDIPDEQGNMKHYRAVLNADFVEIFPTEKAPEITQEDVDILIQNSTDVSLWREKFPPKSWVFQGFLILNLIDITADYGISSLKSALLEKTRQDNTNLGDFSEIFQSIYKIPDLRIGLTLFNKDKNSLQTMHSKGLESFILQKNKAGCKSLLCETSYEKLVQEHRYFSIPNVEEYARKTNNNQLSRNLLANNAKSCILAPIALKDELLGVLELISPRKNELNSINAIKLDDLLPYIVTAVERNRSEYENRIKAVIQNECTSIHPSVLWVFEEEAHRYIQDLEEDGVASFRDISFHNVHPLYGQIDIVGSSDERNKSIQEDLTDQLNAILEIIRALQKREDLPIYEQLSYRIGTFVKNLKENMTAASEQKVALLLKNEIAPILNHAETLSSDIKKKVEDYRQMLDPDSVLIYNKRKLYDISVANINRMLARFIDRKQRDAQSIFPHYFERYKTDGVDHNMYIGQEIAPKKEFNILYLYNLRLWQLVTMCEMENKFYQIQEGSELQLDAASLILVFNSTLSIRYRMDEKKFDIDGTYNARYEIIKKRIDKAREKHSNERITEKGKLVIIYAQKSDEKEYLRYIKYLQAKSYLGENVELLELEDVQGVIGLKAIRVEILYHKEMGTEEKLTYEDLIKELN